MLTRILLLILCTGSVATAADTYPIVMRAGADYNLKMVFTDSAGHPTNLTGTTFAAQFKSVPGPTGMLFATYSTAVTNPTGGEVHLTLSHGWTRALVNKTGYWDLQQTDAAGKIKYRVSGPASVLPTVTNP